MYEIKIYRGLMCHDNEEWCKIGRDIVLPFQDWHEKFDEFCTEHLKFSKNCILMGSFWWKYIMSELKNFIGVMFDGKFQRKLTCAFKNDMKNLENFCSQAEI